MNKDKGGMNIIKGGSNLRCFVLESNQERRNLRSESLSRLEQLKVKKMVRKGININRGNNEGTIHSTLTQPQTSNFAKGTILESFH